MVKVILPRRFRFWHICPIISISEGDLLFNPVGRAALTEIGVSVAGMRGKALLARLVLKLRDRFLPH